MANRGEPLINVVIADKPKMLRGLTKTGGGQAQRLEMLLTQMMRHRRRGGAYPVQSVYLRNVVNQPGPCTAGRVMGT